MHRKNHSRRQPACWTGGAHGGCASSAGRSPAFPQPGQARFKTLAPAIFEATVPPNWKPDGQANYRKRTFETQPAANGLSYFRRQYQQALIVLMVIVRRGAADRLRQRGESAARPQRRAAEGNRDSHGAGSGRATADAPVADREHRTVAERRALGILFAQWGSAAVWSDSFPAGGNPVFLDLSLMERAGIHRRRRDSDRPCYSVSLPRGGERA